jgi:hypothetical protein
VITGSGGGVHATVAKQDSHSVANLQRTTNEWQWHSCLSLTSFPRTGFAPEIAGAAFFTPSLTPTTPDDGASGIVVAYTSCSGQVSVSQWAMSPPPPPPQHEGNLAVLGCRIPPSLPCTPPYSCLIPIYCTGASTSSVVSSRPVLLLVDIGRT